MSKQEKHLPLDSGVSVGAGDAEDLELLLRHRMRRLLAGVAAAVAVALLAGFLLGRGDRAAHLPPEPSPATRPVPAPDSPEPDAPEPSPPAPSPTRRVLRPRRAVKACPDFSVTVHGPEARRDAQGQPLAPGPLARLGWAGLSAGSLSDAVAYSSDGSLVASEMSGYRVRVWTRDDLAATLTVQLPRDAYRGVEFAFGRSSGSLVVLACDAFRFVDPRTGQVSAAPTSGASGRFAIAPDETFAVAGRGRHDAGEVARFDLPSGATRWAEAIPGLVEAAAVTPDGSRVVVLVDTNGENSLLQIRDAATGELLHDLDTGTPTSSSRLVLLRGGRWVLCNGGGSSWPVVDVATGQVVSTIDDGLGPFLVAADPGGTRLVTGNAHLWDVEQMRMVRQLERPRGMRSGVSIALAVSSDGTEALLGGARHAIASLETGELLVDPNERGLVQRVCFLDGTTLVSVSQAGDLWRWDPRTGEGTRLEAPRLRAESPLGGSGTELFGLTRDGAWLRLDLATGRHELARLPVGPGGEYLLSGDGRTLLFSAAPSSFQRMPDGSYEQVENTEPARFVVHRWGEPEPVGAFEVPGTLSHVAEWAVLSGDGQRLFLPRGEATIAVDVASGAVTSELSHDGPGRISSQVGDVLVVGHAGAGTVQERAAVWRVDPPERLAVLPNYYDEGGAVVPGGGHAVVSRRGDTGLWVVDLEAGRLRVFDDPRVSRPHQVAIDPTGTYLVTVQDDQTALVWELSSILEEASEDG